jgi:hypothetical protein
MEPKMEIASGLIKLKPGSDEKVEKWRETISSRLNEAIATLNDEGVEIESWFKIEVGGQKFLLWYMRAESIARAFEVSQTLKHPIDQFHYKLMAEIMDTDGRILAQPIIDITSKTET